ncbi:unnamed protein product [Meloidogyne enterolobii]|uniref:Uncharacterized protein n=1 Tax=Meloidogyne enterolobii TaxID=390850 RepID=A0ACB0ZC00_MELEN
MTRRNFVRFALFLSFSISFRNGIKNLFRMALLRICCWIRYQEHQLKIEIFEKPGPVPGF